LTKAASEQWEVHCQGGHLERDNYSSG
jgi:hypothetical protein